MVMSEGRGGLQTAPGSSRARLLATSGSSLVSGMGDPSWWIASDCRVGWGGKRSADASVMGWDWPLESEGGVSSGFSVARLTGSGSSAVGEGRAAVA